MNTDKTTTDWPYHTNRGHHARRRHAARPGMAAHARRMHAPRGQHHRPDRLRGCGAALATPWAVQKLEPYLTDDEQEEEE